MGAVLPNAPPAPKLLLHERGTRACCVQRGEGGGVAPAVLVLVLQRAKGAARLRTVAPPPHLVHTSFPQKNRARPLRCWLARLPYLGRRGGHPRGASVAAKQPRKVPLRKPLRPPVPTEPANSKAASLSLARAAQQGRQGRGVVACAEARGVCRAVWPSRAPGR